MLKDFLNECQCLLYDEKFDYSEVCRKLTAAEPFKVFQPLNLLDFQPMKLLEKNPEYFPADQKEWVYLMPVNKQYFFTNTAIDQKLLDFYLNDIEPDLHDSEIEFEQVILLSNPLFSLPLTDERIGDVNVIYLEVTVSERRTVHIFLLMEAPEPAWRIMTERYSVGADMMVDSAKGFLEHFPESDFMKNMMKSTSAEHLPGFLLLQYFSRCNMPEEFLFMASLKSRGHNRDLYFTPWGKNTSYETHVCSLLRRKEEQTAAFAKNKHLLEEWLSVPAESVPLSEICEAIEYCKDRITHDGGVTDFSDYRQMMPYDTYEPTEHLSNRAELFYWLALRYIFEKEPGRKREAADELKSLVLYHVRRKELEDVYRNAYIYLDADEDLKYFAEAIYDSVKKLHGFECFAHFIAAEENNALEEKLLSCAYRKKDTEFADWLIENQFFGRVQTELFRIVCSSDRAKAIDLAQRLAPSCIAWILRGTCEIVRRSGSENNIYISESIRLIFANITRKKAENVKMYLKGYAKRGDRDCLTVYDELMTQYFPG